MKLGDIYEFVVKRGMEVDPRGRELAKQELERAKKIYDDLKPEDKESFDKETLTNPYADTRILNGAESTKVKAILAGIDMEVSEIILADRLREKGSKIDLVVTHHPEGKALAGFYDVMRMQADILNKMGVPINVAEGLLEERIKEVARKVMPLNHSRAVDAAKLLDIPLMSIHTPADNSVTTYLQKIIDSRKPNTVSDVMKILKSFPEYKEAIKQKAGPSILIGKPSNRCGKTFVEMTGGTEGSQDIFKKLSAAGVGTLICMHLSEEHYKKAKEEQINIIIAGHIASDNIGLNLIFDELEKKDTFKIITCSGFVRVKR